MYLWVVETKGRSLEETAALFDGEDAVRQLTERAHAEAVGEGQEKESEEKKSDAEIVMEEHVTPVMNV